MNKIKTNNMNNKEKDISFLKELKELLNKYGYEISTETNGGDNYGVDCFITISHRLDRNRFEYRDIISLGCLDNYDLKQAIEKLEHKKE